MSFRRCFVIGKRSIRNVRMIEHHDGSLVQTGDRCANAVESRDGIGLVPPQCWGWAGTVIWVIFVRTDERMGCPPDTSGHLADTCRTHSGHHKSSFLSEKQGPGVRWPLLPVHASHDVLPPTSRDVPSRAGWRDQMGHHTKQSGTCGVFRDDTSQLAGQSSAVSLAKLAISQGIATLPRSAIPRAFAGDTGVLLRLQYL